MLRTLDQKFRRRSKAATFAGALRRTSRSFCRHSTLHGFKYLIQPSNGDRSVRHLCISRILWSATCLLGIVLTLYLIQQVGDKYLTTPTITTIHSSNYPIWKVLFPAVSFCNINKVYGPATARIREKLMKMNISADTVEHFFHNLNALVKARPVDAVTLETYRVLENMNYTTRQLMLELHQPCESMLRYCSWIGKRLPCDTLFRITMNTEGFCCTFNQKALRTELEIQHNSDTVADQLRMPIYRAAGNGEYNGLSVLLDIETEAYLSASHSFVGISVLVHEAIDFPESSFSAHIVQPGEELHMAVHTYVVRSADEVRGAPIAQRDCLYSDEFRLRTTHRYRYQACQTECVVDTILQTCGCIPFYYPHIDGFPYENSRQCSLHDVDCLAQNKGDFDSLQPPTRVDGFNGTPVTGMQCNCLPSCTEQFFRIKPIVMRHQSRYKDLRMPAMTMPTNGNANNNSSSSNTQFARVHVYYEDIACVMYRREIYMTWDALIAAFGGVFSLCLGGSVISLFEWMYEFTFRLGHRMFGVDGPIRRVY